MELKEPLGSERKMRETIYSKNELRYLFNKDGMKREYNKNYLYQIKHIIKQKIQRAIVDLLIALEAGFKLPDGYNLSFLKDEVKEKK